MSLVVPQVVVVTGASGAIGAALAIDYAAPGVCLALLGRNADRLEAVVQRCRAQGADVIACAMDVRDAAALREWLLAFDSQHPVDLLIANAGFASVLRDLSDWESLAAINEVMDTNLLGVINTVFPIAERMRHRGAGHVAIVSSLAAFRGMAISPAYCASKSALRAWGQSVRPLLGVKGVSLTMIYPGFVKSAMSDAFPANKPFLIDAGLAAARIRRGLNDRKANIVFPLSLGLGISLLNVLPERWSNALMVFLKLTPKGRS